MENKKPQIVTVNDTTLPVDPDLQVKPKSSCRHCHGRGYIGTDILTRKKVICRCVQKDFLRVNKLKKAREMAVKDTQLTASKGWEDSTAPAVNPE